MIRILGNILHNYKRIFIGLTTIYGIGKNLLKKILNKININPNTKVKNLTTHNITDILIFLEKNKYKLMGELKQDSKKYIKNLININSYKGKRFLRNLPLNGQRTRTNSRTARKVNFIN